MQDANSRFDRVASRRKTLGLVATVIGGGATLTIAGSRETRATVSVDSLTVDDARFEAESVAPVLTAEIAYAYRHADTSRLYLALEVDGDVVAEESLMTGSEQADATSDLSGRVTDSASFDSADFSTERGETVEVDVPVAVVFEVRNSDGTVLASDRREQTATVTVVSPLESEYATVGGVVSITDGSA